MNLVKDLDVTEAFCVVLGKRQPIAPVRARRHSRATGRLRWGWHPSLPIGHPLPFRHRPSESCK